MGKVAQVTQRRCRHDCQKDSRIAEPQTLRDMTYNYNLAQNEHKFKRHIYARQCGPVRTLTPATEAVEQQLRRRPTGRSSSTRRQCRVIPGSPVVLTSHLQGCRLLYVSQDFAASDANMAIWPSFRSEA